MSEEDTVQARMTGYWDRFAHAYDAHQSARLAEAGEQELWAAVYGDVLGAAPRDVLDVGTGSGTLALVLAAAGHRVTGVDLSRGMLAVAQEEAAGHPHPPRFVLGDAVHPPLPPGSVDAVVSRYLLWTLRAPEVALRQWFDLLRPGGVLVAVDGPWFREEPATPGDSAGSPSSMSAEPPTEREAAFAVAYDAETFAALPFGAAEPAAIVAVWEAAGFTEVRVDPLPQVLARDRERGVAPGHRPQLQYRISGHRPR